MNQAIRFILYISLILFPVAFVGCGGHSDSKRFKIGVSQCSGGDWREKMNEEMKRELLFHDDATIEFRNADDSNEKQIADIRYFIDNGFDIILTAPNEAEKITPIIREAYSKGIPVVIFDRKIQGDSFTAYMELDNEGIGHAAAEYAFSLSNGAPFYAVEITGLPGSTPAQERHQGFISGLEGYSNLNLLASVGGDWNEDSGYRLADSLLALYPRINVVYAHNDPMAVGASRLFKDKGRPDIKILGTDASPLSGMPAVKEGLIDATFIYPTEGNRLVEMAMDILHGLPYERVVHVPALKSVDRSNADILMRQYELLRDETSKVEQLGQINTELWSRNRAQNAFLWTVIGFAIALSILSALLIIFIVRSRRLGRILSIRDFLASPQHIRELHQELTPDSNESPKKETPRNKEEEKEKDRVVSEKESFDSEANVPEGDNSRSGSKGSEFYSRFISIVKQRYVEPDLNTEKIASALSLGATHLSRKIKAQTGLSPIEILRTYRLEQAKHLLTSTDLTINEITHAVGFSSSAYLAKCFREAYGLSPTDFRQK